MRSTVFAISLVTGILSAPSCMAAGGIFTLLVAKPFVAEPTCTTTSPGSFKLSLRTVDGRESTYEKISPRATSEDQFVRQLQPGRSYAFPQCMIDFLGLEETLSTIRSLPAPGIFESYKRPQRGVMDLGRESPFRALVLDQALGDTGYSIVLQGADTRLYHVSGTYGSDLVKRIAERLRRGETYEFPAALDDLQLTPAEHDQAKAGPKSPEAAVLARYIGAWSGTLEDDPKAKVQMDCHWLADGTGIWRELKFAYESSGDPPVIDIARITYDAHRKAYLSADPAADNPAALASVWDDAQQTFTTQMNGNADGQTRINTAIFTTEDRIDWKTVTRNASGKTLDTRRGSYIRTSKTVPPVQLPPLNRTTIVNFVPTGDGRAFSTETIGNTDFFKLREEAPFRGKISFLQIDAKCISATLKGVDLRQYSIRHEPDQNWEKALAIAKRLEPGTTHEFPAALADDYQPPPAGFVPQPTTDAMRALAPFIGQWRMHWTSSTGRAPKDEIILHYFWSHDGTGLWREAHLPASILTGSPDQPAGRARVEGILTTYDPATQRYVEISSSQPLSEKKQNIEWDPQTQTYSLSSGPERLATDIHRTSTRRVVSPDRIEFHSKTTKADGSLQQESTGYYERLQP